MDSLTQIVLGAAVGEATLGKKVGNKAMLWGAIAGTIPDLDVIGRFFMDDISAQEFHRGISHSLIFSSVLAPILGWLLFKFHEKRKNEASFKQWSWMFFLTLVTHPLLDCHTTWGTQFFWPFDLRIAYNNINVVDPAYTLPFLVLVIMALLAKRGSRNRKRLNNLGLIISSAYMLLTIGFKFYTKSVFEKNLSQKNIEYAHFSNKPTFGNGFLWTATVDVKDSFLIGYYSIFDKDRNIQFHSYPKNYDLLKPYENEDQVKRLIFLTQNWYVVQQDSNHLYLCDLRFGESYENSGVIVFMNELINENGKIVVKRKKPDFDKSDFPKLIGMLYRRAFGDKSQVFVK
ncbi:MAG: metal-dependent hydrolase [Flavobacteriales bacterium]|nr:metal-dependent hydrolase [Flavobacteriales bacterium]